MSQKQRQTIKYFDFSLLFIIIFLLGFGLVMLYSTSSYSAMSQYGDSAHYLKQQFKAIVLGFVLMLIISRIPYRVWQKLSSYIYIIALILCTLVIFAGDESHGQSRWLSVGPINFQPSELAKIAVILFMAAMIYRLPKKMGDFKTIVKLLILLVPLVGVIAYNNLSTAIIVAGIGIAMIFVASPKYKQFLVIGGAGVLGVLAFTMLASYRSDRFKIWLHPEQYDKGYQTLQGLYAIGSGGLFGKGLGESMQKMGYVPEAQNDMIFSIICEELGLFGAICVILLFLLMIWRFMVIANNAADLYGSLIVVGILVHIALQVVLNIAVVTNTIPNTGITLPFISYGGTSVTVLLMEMGIALSVSRGIRLEPQTTVR